MVPRQAGGSPICPAAYAVAFNSTGQQLNVDVCAHARACMQMSGVVGSVRARYCLFGDTVNTASRMESTGVAGAIQASETSYNLLPPEKRAGWQFRGSIEVKGKGELVPAASAPLTHGI